MRSSEHPAAACSGKQAPADSNRITQSLGSVASPSRSSTNAALRTPHPPMPSLFLSPGPHPPHRRYTKTQMRTSAWTTSLSALSTTAHMVQPFLKSFTDAPQSLFSCSVAPQTWNFETAAATRLISLSLLTHIRTAANTCGFTLAHN